MFYHTNLILFWTNFKYCQYILNIGGSEKTVHNLNMLIYIKILKSVFIVKVVKEQESQNCPYVEYVNVPQFL